MESRPLREPVELGTRPAVLCFGVAPYAEPDSAVDLGRDFLAADAHPVIAIPDTAELRRLLPDDDVVVLYYPGHGEPSLEHGLTIVGSLCGLKRQDLLRAYPRGRSWTTFSLQELGGPVPVMGTAVAMTTPIPVRTSAEYRAAIAAARSWLEGDTTAPARFATEWLGMSVTKSNRCSEAVATALMDDWWTAARSWSGEEVIKEIKRRTATARLALRPLWERQARGKTVMMLGHRVDAGDDTVTLEEVIADPCGSAEDQALPRLAALDAPCVSVVLAGLSEREAEVALAYAINAGIDWTQAALRTGAPEPFGTRVARKLARLGRRHHERARSITTRTGSARCPHGRLADEGGQH